MSTKKHSPSNEKPISLHPLSLEDALGKAMNVQPILENYGLLVKYLASTRINEHHRTRAYDVANDLLKAVLREQWHSLSDAKRKKFIRDSGGRLWNSYMQERQRPDQSPRGAAKVAIDIELTYLLDQTKASI